MKFNQFLVVILATFLCGLTQANDSDSSINWEVIKESDPQTYQLLLDWYSQVEKQVLQDVSYAQVKKVVDEVVLPKKKLDVNNVEAFDLYIELAKAKMREDRDEENKIRIEEGKAPNNEALDFSNLEGSKIVALSQYPSLALGYSTLESTHAVRNFQGRPTTLDDLDGSSTTQGIVAGLLFVVMLNTDYPSELKNLYFTASGLAVFMTSASSGTSSFYISANDLESGELLRYDAVVAREEVIDELQLLMPKVSKQEIAARVKRAYAKKDVDQRFLIIFAGQDHIIERYVKAKAFTELSLEGIAKQQLAQIKASFHTKNRDELPTDAIKELQEMQELTQSIDTHTNISHLINMIRLAVKDQKLDRLN